MKSTLFCFFFCFTGALFAQTENFEAIIFEANNRGFLNQVKVNVYDITNNALVAELTTNATGQAIAKLPEGRTYRVFSRKDIFLERNDTVTISDSKTYVKIELKRKPGYLFDATLAEVRTSPDQMVDAIDGARLEIYNFTTKKLELIREKLDGPYFQFTFEQGNHYIILIRKEGYLAKRIDAHVNIDGCIICLEGVTNLRPGDPDTRSGVTDVLTAGLSMGTLLANIDMVKAVVDAKIEVSNINWPYNSAEITPQTARELDKAIVMLKANPEYAFEMGSHTDSRGGDTYNFELSHKRAEAAVAYMILKDIDPTRLKATGYGETQLKNKCANGINCSDAEHASNRRTELKITGIFPDAKEFVPLVEILRRDAIDREREKLLREDTKEIQVPEIKVPAPDSTLVAKDTLPVAVPVKETPKQAPGTTTPMQPKANLPITTKQNAPDTTTIKPKKEAPALKLKPKQDVLSAKPKAKQANSPKKRA
jgi:outer membrane protein OmpA-like peptidoglycan-associated protein